MGGLILKKILNIAKMHGDEVRNLKLKIKGVLIEC